MTALTLRQRVIRGAGAQIFNNVVRIVVQLGGVAVLLPVWGLSRYGEWLILSAVPTYLAFSDLGYFAAARSDMIMAVSRGDDVLALGVFRAVSRGVGFVTAALVVGLPLLAALLPITDLLHLNTMGERTAEWAVVMLGLDTLLVSYAGLLQGGFACAGFYGDGAFALAAITLVEFLGLAAAVVITQDVAVAATAMLGARLIGTIVMYIAMRRRVPWLSLGRRVGQPEVLSRLTRPAIASAGFPTALAMNIQGMVVLVGIAVSPAAAAIFSTVRTFSRIVIQLLASVSAIVAPEFSRAFGADDVGLMRRIHRRGCQAAVWMALAALTFLAILGPTLIHAFTRGRVDGGGALLYVFLAAAATDSLWYTSVAVLFSTNRHARISLTFFVACAVSLPLAYVMLNAWGLIGAAWAMLLLELFMLFAVLRQSLPAAHDSLIPWLRAIATPPRPGLVRGRSAPS